MNENKSDIETKAEIFKIIRANQDKTPRQIITLIKQRLPDIREETIGACISDLINQ